MLAEQRSRTPGAANVNRRGFFSRGGDVCFSSGRVKMVVDIRQTDGMSEYYS